MYYTSSRIVWNVEINLAANEMKDKFYIYHDIISKAKSEIAVAFSHDLGYYGKTNAVQMNELINLFDKPFMASFWTWNNHSSVKKQSVY